MAGKKHQHQQPPAMVHIVIAGGGGFAFILAQQLSQAANPILILSTQNHPEFEALECQVLVVDYTDTDALRYALQGADLVISTISGTEQMNLIDAARKVHVRTFVPSEFEGAMAQRPNEALDPLDRGTHATVDILNRWSQSKSHRMAFTVFSCGIFYERFAPGGLASFNMGGGQIGGAQMPGDFLVDIEAATAEIVDVNAQGRPVVVSMTSAFDVARFIAAAIELGPNTWPTEFRMRGDNMAVADLVRACSAVREVPFHLTNHLYVDLGQNIAYYEELEGWARWHYLQRLAATANGRYHIRQPNLNERINSSNVVDVQPIPFRDWLAQIWGPAQLEAQLE